jgi:aldose 1-epimerase
LRFWDFWNSPQRNGEAELGAEGKAVSLSANSFSLVPAVNSLYLTLKLMALNKEKFNNRIDGKQTSLHFLENKNMQVAITNYGARIVAITLKPNDPNPVDVVIGFDSIAGYLDATETYHGTIVGRYANRIANGRFSLGGKQYQLAINNPPSHLHGGPKGFHNQVWDIQTAERTKIKLNYFSKDGEENYPGNLHVSVTYI